MQTVKAGDHVIMNDGTEIEVFDVSDDGWVKGVIENGINTGAPISTRKECVTFYNKRMRFDNSPFADSGTPKKEDKLPKIKRVIFNPPATIVLWKDGSKTVVKVHNEEFDKEKGLAMAILRSEYGAGIRKLFRKWCADDKDET